MTPIVVALVPSGRRIVLNLDTVPRWELVPGEPRQIRGYSSLDPGAASATFYLTGELRDALGPALEALGVPRFVTEEGYDDRGQPDNPNPYTPPD